jgi:hypothetical protein
MYMLDVYFVNILMWLWNLCEILEMSKFNILEYKSKGCRIEATSKVVKTENETNLKET